MGGKIRENEADCEHGLGWTEDACLRICLENIKGRDNIYTFQRDTQCSCTEY